MSTSPSVLPTLVGFAVAMILLYLLSRRVSIEIQTVIYLITRSLDMSTIGLFLVLLPGIFIHESAHWVMARLLGLRTGKFRVWPKRQGRVIGMGQVTVEQGGVWLDSLVGMAPLLVGSIIVALIGRHIFGAHQLLAQAYEGNFSAAASVFTNAMRAADSALWAYLLFAVANAMMPSASDREPLLPVLLYVGLAALTYLVLGLPLTPFSKALDWLVPMIQDLTSGLLLTIVLDVVILALLSLLTLLFSPSKRQSR